MSDQAPSMAELKSASTTAESNDSSTDTSDVSEDEYIDAPSVNVRPESGLYFDEIVDFGFTGELNYAQNFRGDERVNLTDDPTGGYGGSFAITLSNPRVGDGQLWKSTDEGQTSDYRLVGPETTSVDTVEAGGEEVTVGMEYSGRTFKSERVEDFDEEYITVYLSGGIGEYIGRRLDALGGMSTQETLDGADDYDHPVGLLERPPEGWDAEAAVRRQPILRTDMMGSAGAILFELGGSDDSEDDDGESDDDEETGAFLASIFTFDDEGDFEPLEPIADADHEGVRDTGDVYRGELAWPDSHDGSTSSGASSDDSVDEATDDLSFDGITDGTSDTDGSSDETTYETLPDTWQAFVDNVVGTDGIDVEDYDFETAISTFESKNDGVVLGDLTADEIADIAIARS